MQRESEERLHKEVEHEDKKIRRKEQKDKYTESLEQDIGQDNPVDPTSTLGNTMKGVHLPLAELRFVPFTLSKHLAVACLDMIFFDPKKKFIVRRSKKRLRTDTRLEVVTVTTNTVVQETNQDLVFLASLTVAVA